MSNSVRFVNGLVLLRNDEFDVARFVNLMSQPEVTDDSRKPAWYGDPGYNENVNSAWWFLHGAWRMDEQGKGVWISFGSGRSMHTWRDFKFTLHILRQFMKLPKQPKYFTFTDDSDGHRKVCRMQVNFWSEEVIG